MSKHITHVTDATFTEEVLSSQIPVLVDYWAEWCRPCLAIAPFLDEIAQEYQGQLKVAKLNVDQNQETPQKYSIRSIPTLILFKQGQQVGDAITGQRPKSEFVAFINSHL